MHPLEELKVFRKRKQLTLRELAEIIDCNPIYLNRVENGERIPDKECANAICDALELNEEEKTRILHYFGY